MGLAWCGDAMVHSGGGAEPDAAGIAGGAFGDMMSSTVTPGVSTILGLVSMTLGICARRRRPLAEI